MMPPENDTPSWLDALDVPPPSDDDMPTMATDAGFDAVADMGATFAAPKKPLEPADLSEEAIMACLNDQFGLPSFREGQREVIDTVLAGNSALAVMPTGAGKSLCYQLPAMLLPGVALVISPLIALMKDQVDSLQAKGLPATFINSSLSWPEQRERLNQMRRGEIKMVFVAPERFRSDAFRSAIAQTHISLLAIDEAHCVSEWGHDFRPDYLALGKARLELDKPVTLALTATATPNVRKDIVRLLGIPNADIFVSGFERPNLFLEVYKARGKKDKLARMEALIRHMGGTSIVYCATRKAVDEVAGELRMATFKVGTYHGGMSDSDRDSVQDNFMDGAYDVLVATNAFGMGVDKSDIRAIVHYQIPSSLEAYYQEAGRAGRDGGASHCLLLYNYADRHVPDFFIQNSHPDRAIIEGTYKAIKNGVRRYDTRAISRQIRGKVSHMAVGSALRLLRRAGHIEYQAQYDEPIQLLDPGALNIDWRALDKRRDFEGDKLQKVIYYAAGKRCRTMDILRYFGSKASFEDRCGHCDKCADVAPYATTAMANAPRLVAGDSGGRKRKGRSRISSGDRKVPRQIPLIRAPEPNATVIRKILACIARGRQRLSVTMIGRILTGSKAASVLKYGHDKNSTYNLLGGLSAKQITALLDDMIDADFLRQEGVCVRLTVEAVEVMKGEKEMADDLKTKLDARFERSSSDPVRKAMAKVLGMDKGSKKPRARKIGDTVTGTVAETLALLIEGHTIKDVARDREIKLQTVVKHVVQGARAGAVDGLDFEPYVDGPMLPVLRTVAEEQDWEGGLRDFREAVSAQLGGRRVSYDLMKMNIAYLISKGELQ